MNFKNICFAGLSVFLLTTILRAQPGYVDSSFNGDGRQEVYFDLGGDLKDDARGVAFQSDGKLVVVGTSQHQKPGGPVGDCDFSITRLFADGSLDSSFGTGGKAVFAFDWGQSLCDWSSDVAIQSDGKIVVVGSVPNIQTGDMDMAVLRLDTSGGLDSSFGSSGRAGVHFDQGGDNRDLAFAVAIQGDGKIIVVGAAEKANADYDMAVARLTSTGNYDSAFGQGGKVTVGFDLGYTKADTAYAVALQSDGKIIIVGEAFNAQANADFAMVRLNADGVLDSSFDGDGKKVVAFDVAGLAHDSAYDVVIQSDGKIVVVGSASNYNPGDEDFAVTRLTSSGSLDSGFGVNGKTVVAFDLGFPNRDVAEAVSLQTDGKILLGGSASWSGSDYDYALARLKSNGSMDTSFGSNGTSTVAFDLGSNKGDYFDDMVIVNDGSGPKVIMVGSVDRGVAADTDFGITRVNL